MEYINSLYNIQEVNLKNNVIEKWHYSEEDMQMPMWIWKDVKCHKLSEKCKSIPQWDITSYSPG